MKINVLLTKVIGLYKSHYRGVSWGGAFGAAAPRVTKGAPKIRKRKRKKREKRKKEKKKGGDKKEKK